MQKNKINSTLPKEKGEKLQNVAKKVKQKINYKPQNTKYPKEAIMLQCYNKNTSESAQLRLFTPKDAQIFKLDTHEGKYIGLNFSDIEHRLFIALFIIANECGILNKRKVETKEINKSNNKFLKDFIKVTRELNQIAIPLHYNRLLNIVYNRPSKSYNSEEKEQLKKILQEWAQTPRYIYHIRKFKNIKGETILHRIYYNEPLIKIVNSEFINLTTEETKKEKYIVLHPVFNDNIENYVKIPNDIITRLKEHSTTKTITKTTWNVLNRILITPQTTLNKLDFDNFVEITAYEYIKDKHLKKARESVINSLKILQECGIITNYKIEASGVYVVLSIIRS